MFLNCFGSRNSSGRHFPVIKKPRRFSLADIRKITNNFHKKRVIGRGGYGELYKGYLQHKDGASDYAVAVAVKRFKVKRWQVLKTEIELLCGLHHRNIISVVGFCNHRKEKIIVYQYLSNGSLYQKLLEGGKLSWKKRLEICTRLALALNYLHAGSQCTIIHRYINPSNILLDDKMQPILAGFDLAVQVCPSTPKPMQLENVEGTIGYIAPEHLKDGTISYKSDVYSFGVILLEVVWGRTIFDMTGSENYLEKPVEEDIDPNIKGNIAPECWQVFIDIAQRCLKHEPDERPTMLEANLKLQHALLLQEQADISNTLGDYIIMSKTIININPHENIIKKVETDSYCMPEDVSDLEDTLRG